MPEKPAEPVHSEKIPTLDQIYALLDPLITRIARLEADVATLERKLADRGMR